MDRKSIRIIENKIVTRGIIIIRKETRHFHFKNITFLMVFRLILKNPIKLKENRRKANGKKPIILSWKTSSEDWSTKLSTWKNRRLCKILDQKWWRRVMQIRISSNDLPKPTLKSHVEYRKIVLWLPRFENNENN